MKFVISFLTLLVMITTSFATELPPRKYDPKYHPPTVAYKLNFVSFKTVQKKCESQIVWESLKLTAKRKSADGLYANGCAIINNETRRGAPIQVWIRNDLAKKETDILVRHELGHVNGWVHN